MPQQPPLEGPARLQWFEWLEDVLTADAEAMARLLSARGWDPEIVDAMMVLYGEWLGERVRGAAETARLAMWLAA